MRCLDVSNNNAEQELKESIKNKKIVLVLFHSDNCLYCKMMMPEFKKFYTEEPENKNVLISKIEKQNIDRFPLPVKLDGYPTIKIFKKNKELDTFENNRTQDEFSNFLKKHIRTLNKERKSSQMRRPTQIRRPSRSRSSFLDRPKIYSLPHSRLSNTINRAHLDLLRRRSESNFERNMNRLSTKLNLKNRSLPLSLTRNLTLKNPNMMAIESKKKKKKAPSKKPSTKKNKSAKKKKSSSKKGSSKKKKGSKK